MSARAEVSLRAYPLWRLHLRRGLPRYLLAAVSLFGIAASARYAIAPPMPSRTAGGSAHSPGPDRAAEAYAVLFARRYLTWTGTEPPPGALEQFVGGGMEGDAGLVVPSGIAQKVAWAEVAQAREPLAGQHVYTVAAQTDTGGLLYLTVGVLRTSSGALALSGYPAFVGPPDSAAAPTPPHGQVVNDPALEVVLRRALGNYLSASASELAADLTAGAQVSPPPNPLALDTFGAPTWTEGGGVEVFVQAVDARGVRYSLAYELDVSRVRGRWEISAIQTDPRS
jgi:Conjugative transposon protein TcpC